MNRTQSKKTKSKVKKLEDSFTEDYTDINHDTELQTFQNPNPIKSLQHQTNNKLSFDKVHKKEQDKLKLSKNQPTIKFQNPKIFEDQDNQQPNQIKKYESFKSIKDCTEDDDYQKNISLIKTQRKNTNKKLLDHQKLEEIQKKANEIIEKLDEVYDQDVELYKQGKPADKKLKFILEIEKKLKQIELAKTFLNLNGHLVFVEWLLLNPETRQETSLTVKIHVLSLLADMHLTKENVEAASELEKVVKMHRKSRYDTLRNLSCGIVEKWKILRAISNA